MVRFFERKKNIMNRKVPPKLYKYQSYSTQTLDNLKNRLIWFSKPSRFNDPFDCSIIYLVEDMKDEDIQDMYDDLKKQYIKSSSQNEQIMADFSGDKPSALFRERLAGFLTSNFKKVVNNQLGQAGIACFSENVNNILMWSHYADGHRGLCLEFDCRYEPFRSAVAVQYSDKLPTLYKPEDDSTDLQIRLATTKSTGWAYEKEWRLIIRDGDKVLSVDTASLTGIYFGCAMPSDHKEAISLILRDTPTKIYDMKRSETEFKVEIYESSSLG